MAALAIDPSRPRFTGYTAAGRTELSGTVLLNWSSKVAGLLLDELGARPGDAVLVSTPGHWQTVGILIGAWWAGLAVTHDPTVDAVAAFVEPGGDADSDEVFVVSGHPLGLASRDLPGHQRDYTTAVLSQADRFSARSAGDPSRAIITGGQPVPAAVLRGAIRSPSGLITGQRVLTAGPWTLDGRMPAVVADPVPAVVHGPRKLPRSRREKRVPAGERWKRRRLPKALW